MRRVFAFAFVVCLMFVPSISGADTDVAVQFRFASGGERPNDFTPRPGTTLTDTWKIVIDASAASTLKYFKVAIEHQQQIPESLPPSSTVFKTYPAGSSTSDRLSLQWDTQTITKYNGVYRVVGVAESHGGSSTRTSVDDLKVDNPPAIPTNVSARLENDQPVIAWSANPEPDIRLYRIYRSDDSSSFELVGSTSERSLKDSGAPASKSLRYQVVAVRISPVSSSGIASSPSKPTPAISITPPPSASTKPPSQPIDNSNPVPIPALAPKKVMAKQTDLGFAPVLPYESLDLPVEAESVGTEVPGESTSGAQSLPQIVRSTIYKPPFIAAALLLLVSALHVLRFARNLFVAPSSTNTARILGSST